MKRLILGLFTIASVVLGSITAIAQPFMPAADTVSVFYTSSGTQDIHNDISIPGTGYATYIKWNVVNHDFPASWSADSNVSACDNYNCYTNMSGNLLGGTLYKSSAYAVGQTGLFKLSVNIPNGANGSHYVTINLKDSMSTYNKNITFLIHKVPTSASTVNKTNEDVVLYPNPATDDLNVMFDDGIKNIAVYNLIGKAMVVYKVAGNSAKMDISKLPNGVYFIRLSDAKGQVVATRRFTKQ